MHALYALAGLSALSADVVLPRLADDHPRVREHALRLSESGWRPILLRSGAWISAQRPEDGDMRVRYQAAFSVGVLDASARIAPLVAILKRERRPIAGCAFSSAELHWPMELPACSTRI